MPPCPFLLLIPTVLSVAAMAAGDDRGRVEDPKTLTQTVKAAMEEYLQTATRLCGTVRERSGTVKDGQLVVDTKVDIEIKQNGRYGYLIESRKDEQLPQPSRRALLYGPKIRARLAQTGDGKWYVSGYTAGGEPVRNACWIVSYYTAPGYFLEPGFDWQFACSLWSQTAVVKSVQWTKLEGKDVVKVVYSTEHPVLSRDGGVWLDPEWNWAIVRQEERRKGVSGEPSVLTMVYDESFRPAPVPKVLDLRWKGRDGKPDGWWRSEFDLRLPEKTPSDEEFTLATFGIDEPDLSRRVPERGPWLWVGMLACLLAALLWWVRRRLGHKPQHADEQ